MRAHQPGIPRGEAKTKPVRSLAVQRTLDEIIPRRGAQLTFPQRRPEILGRGRVDLPELLAWVGTLTLARDVLHLDARLPAYVLHRIDEVETKPLLHEREDVALLVANEADVSAPGRHGEVRILSLVERTGPAKAVAHALQLHVFADDRDDVRRLAD